MTNEEVQKLSDAELSRAIAERLGPEPDVRPQITGHIGLDVMTNISTDIGPWRYVFNQIPKPETPRDFINTVDISDWQPRDMINDPAMTLMLITRMVCTIKCYGTTRVVIMFKNQNKESCSIDAPIGRAVAEAFLFSSGEQ